MDLWTATGGAGLPGQTPFASKVAVVGCGNWLSGDDRIGPRVLRDLSQRLDSRVAVEDVGTSVLGLLDRLHGQELLILVDACVGRAAPGTVLVVEPDLDQPLTPRSSAHQIGPLETLIVARELYPERFPRRVVWVLIETGGLDAEAERSARRQAVAAVEREIEQWATGATTDAAPLERSRP